MNLVIWGTGKAADDFMKLLDFDNISILAFVDNNSAKQGTVFKDIAKIISPQEATELQYDLLIIGSSFEREIAAQCEKLGLKNYISGNDITWDTIKNYPDMFHKHFLNKVYETIDGTIDETGKTNYFDVENEFFLIDSDNLHSVETKLYGYSIQNTGIYENDNLTEAAVLGLNGCGAYVYVEEKRGVEITIRQDFNGSYGIYLYQNDTYFALSNSFFRLLEHIKTKFPISLNRDYANHIFIDILANSVSYKETPINEIELIDRNAVITIDMKEKTLTFDYIDYAEKTLLLNSSEGIAVLDGWFRRWTAVFRNLGNQTDQLIATLSGGFDSRLTFLLVLMSGIDLNKINVNSVKDTIHTYTEDYEIASSIADYYGFRLNDVTAIEDCGTPALNDGGSSLEPALSYSLEDVINIEFYTKMAFHKEMFFKYYRPETKRYMIKGTGPIKPYGGEMPMQEFIANNVERVSRYSPNLAKEISESTTRLASSTYEIIRKKCGISDNVSVSGHTLHSEMRDRSHSGKWAVEDYHYNIYTLAPLIDPELRKIQLSTPECKDDNLLMVMIYVRYCPKLLEFKFNGGHSFSAETIEYAKKINESFPVKPDLFSCHAGNEDSEFNVITKDSSVSEYIKNNKLNTTLVKGDGEKYLKSVFNSTAFQKLFTTCFNEEIYNYAKVSYARKKYFPMRECYAVIGITKVIESVMTSREDVSPSLKQSLDRFLCENDYKGCIIRKDDGEDVN